MLFASKWPRELWVGPPCAGRATPWLVTPRSTGPDDVRVVPNYSRDIDAAWQVVEAMRRKDYAFEALVSREFGMPTATFAKNDSVSVAYRCLDAPEAICRAALGVLSHDTMGSANKLET